MTNRSLFGVLWCAAFLPLHGNEVETLLNELEVPERFAAHTPAFAVTETEREFMFSDGPQTWGFYVLHDGDRVIGFMPKVGFHGGSLYLYTHDPAQAPKELVLPTERFHIDSAPGISFRTDHFLPTKNMHEGDETVWSVAGDASALTLTRRYSGELKTYKWELDTRKKPLQVDHSGTFVLRCDPRTGYTVDATWDTAVDRPTDLGQYVSVYPPDMSNPWVKEGMHQRVVTSPRGTAGWIAHANNHPAIHLSDNDAGWSLRDGGFTAYLEPESGWSWAGILMGADARLSVCNVHADQDLLVEWPKDLPKGGDGKTRHVVRVRQQALPPEVTRRVWERAELRFADRSMVVLPVGEMVDFEDQPRTMGEAVKGLTWTDNFPEISRTEAHSGSRSMVVKGMVFPNLPQVVTKPNTRYRIEGWYKVLPATPGALEDLRKAHEREAEKKRARWQAEVEKASKKGGEPPVEPVLEAWEVPPPATAHITAHYYRWSPHNAGDRVLEQRTNDAPAGQGWVQVSLEFTTPDWAPFVDIRFVCTGGGTAYLDDLSIRELAADAVEVGGE